MSTNPLAKYFRQPAIHTKLPSKGQFWPEGSLELPVTGEIPIYPMTAKDEVTIRTPDALMNGSSVVDVIQSCCPNIKDAWRMPSVDVDALLIAIRIASYGHEMDVDTHCPYCKEENNNAVDLRDMLGRIVCPDFSKKIEINGLKIKLKPQEFKSVNKQNAITFEEQRILDSLSNVDLDKEVRIVTIAASMSKLVELGISTVTDSTDYIELEDGTIVNNPDHIREFYNKADGSVVKSIQTVLIDTNKDAAIKASSVKCVKCEKDYEVPMEFDYANFFVKGS